MIGIRWFLAGAAAATVAVGVLLWTGCSCEDSEEPAGELVVVEEKPKQPVQAAQGAPERKAEQGRRRPRTGFFTAPADYARVTVDARSWAERKVDIATIQNELKHFYAFEGRHPHSLKELEDWRGQPLPELPKGYTYKYDPATGKLEAVRPR